MFKKLYHTLLPTQVRASYRACVNLLREHGLWRTFKDGPVTKEGDRLPWITYPAISYLKSLDLSQAEIFEFGSGSSTKFWSSVAKSVVSVEGEVAWYNKVKPELPANATLHLAADESVESYIAPLVESGRKFDIIFIDGWHRPECARMCLPYLKSGGIIIHDNTEWYQQTREVLLGYDLIPVDFFGFIPCFACTGITSFYIDRQCSLMPRRMPDWLPGTLPQDHERQVHRRE